MQEIKLYEGVEEALGSLKKVFDITDEKILFFLEIKLKRLWLEAYVQGFSIALDKITCK